MRPIVGIAFVLAVLAITASSATAQEIIIEFNNYLVNVVTGYQPDTAGGIVGTNKTIEDVITTNVTTNISAALITDRPEIDTFRECGDDTKQLTTENQTFEVEAYCSVIFTRKQIGSGNETIHIYE